MKIEKQPLENHQVKLTVEMEPEAMEEAKRRAARGIARKTKIPGFRPGKAPYQVIVRQVGEAAILEEALEILVNDQYSKIIEEADVKPYGPGSLEKVVSMEPPVLEFVVPLEAEVQLGDYHAIQKEYDLPPTEEKEVDALIHDLRERQAIVEPVERPAQEGDLVYLKLSGNRLNVEEGEDSTLVRERSLPVLVRSESDDHEPETEWPYPGFSKELVGVSKGDEKTVKHTFTDDSEFESLRGAEAEFHFVVEDVKARTLPELDDDFAKSLGDFENVEELRKEVRTSIETQAKDAYNDSYTNDILEQVVEQSTIAYPPQMLERELEGVIDNLKDRLEQQNMSLDLYLKSRNMDMDALRQEVTPVAETRLKRSLVLMQVAEAEKIEVQPVELQAETVNTLDMLSRGLSDKDANKLYTREVINNLTGSVLADLMVKKAMRRLRAIASGIPEEETPAEEPETIPADLPEASAESSAEPEAAPQEGEPASEGAASEQESSTEAGQ